MQAGHSAARSVVVSAVVGAGQDRPRGSAEAGRGIDDKIGDRIRGEVIQGSKWGRGRR